MSQEFVIILDPREEKSIVDMGLRGKLCYLDNSGSEGPVLLYVDQKKRWSHEGDPAWQRANSDYPDVRTSQDAIEDVRYELGLCKWLPENPVGKAARFIDVSDADILDQIENDLNVKLDRQAIVSDLSVLWSYKQRVDPKTQEAEESAA